VYQIDIALYGDTLTRVAGRFTIHATPPDPTFATIQFDNTWYVWNSNVRSMDRIVTEFWYKAGGVGPELPLPFTLGYWLNPTTKKPGLYFNWSIGSRLPAIINLPVQPLNYWLPRPLP